MNIDLISVLVVLFVAGCGIALGRLTKTLKERSKEKTKNAHKDKSL